MRLPVGKLRPAAKRPETGVSGPARAKSTPAGRSAALLALGLIALAAAWCGTEVAPPEPPPRLAKTVIGYYPSWKRTVFDHSRVDYGSLSHIAHAFAWPDSTGNLVVPADLAYPELNAAAHANGVKVILSLGGWGNCAGFPGTASSAVNRARFIGQALDFCLDNDYDGVDIDWEFVEAAQQQADFVELIRELSAALHSRTPALLLTMAAPAGDYYGRWIAFEELAAEFDYIGFMTYDFHGPWSDHSGHNSPLYADPGDACGSVHETFLYAKARGVPPEKILLGVPFYGRSFDCGGLGLPFTASQEYSFADVMALPGSQWTKIWDASARVPYLRRGDYGAVVCYDDAQSVAAKCDYVRSGGAAGVIVWEISQDFRNGRSELLEAIGQSFGLRR